MSQQFVINKTSGNFATSLGKYALKPGEALPVTENDLQDAELSYAINQNLLELSDSPNVVVENPPLGAYNLDTSLVPKPKVYGSLEDVFEAAPTPEIQPAKVVTFDAETGVAAEPVLAETSTAVEVEPVEVEKVEVKEVATEAAPAKASKAKK